MIRFLNRKLRLARRRTTAGMVRLARDSGAVVMIEVAFCVPILCMIGFGGIEYANLVLAQTRVSQLGLQVEGLRRVSPWKQPVAAARARNRHQ